MVQNKLQLRTVASDPISALVADRGGPIKHSDLDEEDAGSVIECARPNGGRRRDSIGMQMRRQWWVQLLYYAGIQNLDVSDLLADVAPNVIEAHGSYTANHVMRLVMGNVARLSSARVDWSVVPNTPDQIDQQAAKVGQHVLDHLYKDLKLGQKRLKACLSLDIFGNAFAYSGWDPNKGQVRKFYYDPMTRQPVAKQQLAPGQAEWLEQLGAYEEKSDGDHDDRMLTPFDVWLPTRFEELDDMPWVLIRRTYSIDQVWDRWPGKAAELPDSGTEPSDQDQYRNRIASLVKREGLVFANADQNDGAMDVDEFWMPPSKRVPSGLYIAATKDTVLEWGPHKFAEAGIDIRFPIIDFHNIRVPGRFYSMSTVEHLIGPQAEYNRARSQLIKHRDILGTPQWIAPIGTLKSVVRNETGDIVEYNPRIGKPELVAPPPLGDHQIVSGQQAQSDMQMIASFSDASLGNMPQGARSGNAVAMLQERDQQGIGPTVSELESAFERWGTQLLKLEHKFAKIPRTIQVYGESRQADIRYFKGSDLNGNTRVTVKAGSMTPKSKAATIELMTSMMTLGVLNPAVDPKEKRLVLEALEVGSAERLFLLEDGSRRRAKIENLMFSKPDPSPQFAFPDVTMWDDHQAHYEEHLQFIHTDEYELLNPMLKLMFQAHLNKHINAVAEQAIAMGAVGAMAGGGGGGGSPDAKPLGKASPPSQNGAKKSGPNP